MCRVARRGRHRRACLPSRIPTAGAETRDSCENRLIQLNSDFSEDVLLSATGAARRPSSLERSDDYISDDYISDDCISDDYISDDPSSLERGLRCSGGSPRTPAPQRDGWQRPCAAADSD
jgi:hypothetical protein